MNIAIKKFLNDEQKWRVQEIRFFCVYVLCKSDIGCPQHFSYGAHDFSHWGEWRL